MDVSMTMWVLTVVGLCALIAVDFFIGGRKPHEVEGWDEIPHDF